jgi:hypothetical protein
MQHTACPGIDCKEDAMACAWVCNLAPWSRPLGAPTIRSASWASRGGRRPHGRPQPPTRIDGPRPAGSPGGTAPHRVSGHGEPAAHDAPVPCGGVVRTVMAPSVHGGKPRRVRRRAPEMHPGPAGPSRLPSPTTGAGSVPERRSCDSGPHVQGPSPLPDRGSCHRSDRIPPLATGLTRLSSRATMRRRRAAWRVGWRPRGSHGEDEENRCRSVAVPCSQA